jgi:hypothetical protein
MQMNLFRSEEHARAWPRFDAASTEGIKSVAEFAAILFSLPRYRERLAPDYLLRLDELSREFPAALARLGRGAAFWQPAPAH